MCLFASILKFLFSTVVLLALAAPAQALFITHDIDDFEDGTMQNWFLTGNPNPSQHLFNGGRPGKGKKFFRVTSNTGSGPNSRLFIKNNLQWTGNLLLRNVSRVFASLNNLGSNTLHLRVALQNANGTRYVSSNSFILQPGSDWVDARFSLMEQDLTRISGQDTYSSTLTNVTEFRILSSTTPSYEGDSITATLGIDNISTVPEPSVVALMTIGLLMVLPRRTGA